MPLPTVPTTAKLTLPQTLISAASGSHQAHARRLCEVASDLARFERDWSVSGEEYDGAAEEDTFFPPSWRKPLLRTSVSSHQVRGGVDEGEDEDEGNANEKRNDDANDFLLDKDNLSEVSDEEDDVSAEEADNFPDDGMAPILTFPLSLTLTVA